MTSLLLPGDHFTAEVMERMTIAITGGEVPEARNPAEEDEKFGLDGQVGWRGVGHLCLVRGSYWSHRLGEPRGYSRLTARIVMSSVCSVSPSKFSTSASTA
jgi:hypothetical protein